MNAGRIKLVVFDLDGTLVDAYAAVTKSINYSMKKHGLPGIDALTIKRSVGFGEKKLIKKFVGEKRFESVLKVYQGHHDSALKRGVKFLPHAKNLLKKLKSDGYILAIASNRPYRSSKIILKVLKMDHFFSFVLCGDMVRNPKPSAEMLRRILKNFSLTPKGALYVGDMTIDALTGKRAGIKTVIVLTGSSTRADLRACVPEKIIANLSELSTILGVLNKEK